MIESAAIFTDENRTHRQIPARDSILRKFVKRTQTEKYTKKITVISTFELQHQGNRNFHFFYSAV